MASKLRSRSLPALNRLDLQEPFATEDSNPLVDCPSEEPTPPWLQEELQNVFVNSNSQESVIAQSLPEVEGCADVDWSESSGRRRVSSLSDICRYYRYYEVIRRHSDHFPWGYPGHMLFTSSPVLDDVPPECPVESMYVPYQPSFEDCYFDEETFLEDMDSFSSSMEMWEDANAMANELDPVALDDSPEAEGDDSLNNGFMNYNFNHNFKMFLKL